MTSPAGTQACGSHKQVESAKTLPADFLPQDDHRNRPDSRVPAPSMHSGAGWIGWTPTCRKRSPSTDTGPWSGLLSNNGMTL